MNLELKNKFKEEAFKGDKTEEKAIEKAYADMSRRATGHKEEMKNACIKYLLEEKVFEEALSCQSQEEFDQWHQTVCEKLTEIHGDFGRTGRSQKIVNMAFKYLSCVGDGGKYRNVLKFCHMTLDSYTLNWYKTIIQKEEQKTLTEWSKIKDYDNQYYPIQINIRKHLKSNPKYSVLIGKTPTKEYDLPDIPFEAEFIIWEGEKINSKYNELVKSLNKYKLEGQKNDEWLIGDIFDTYLNNDFKQ